MTRLKYLFSHFGLIAALAGCGILCGCDKPKEGPKRSDDAIAHKEHYHPAAQREFARAPRTQSSQPTTLADEDIQPPATSRPGPVGSPVLFVNGDTVTVPDILEPILPELRDDARTLPAQTYEMSMLKTIRQQIDLHVSTLLIYQEAKSTYPDKAMEIIDKEVDRRIKDVVTDHYGGVFARYEAELKSMELTMDDIKTRIKRQIIVSQFMRDRYKPLLREPPRRQLYKYYQDHIDDYTTPERAELFLIEIPDEAALDKPRNAATTQEIAEARKRALARLKRAREEIDSGIEFAAVARAYSKGLKAEQGGSWGEISPNTLRGRWAKAGEVLFTLKENQVGEPTEGDQTVFLVKCGKRTPAQRVSFEEAQSKIIDRIKDEQFNELSQEHVRKLMDKATIRPLAEFGQACAAAAPRPKAPGFGPHNTEDTEH